MESQDLKEYKEKLGQLTEEEQKQRDLYLKGLADGTLEGPAVGYPNIDKPWLKYYSDSSIVAPQPQMSVYDYVKFCNKDRLDCVVLNYYGVKITYREFFANVDRVIAALIENGIKQGDVVSLGLPSVPETFYTFFAINAIGAVANFIDPRINEERIEQCVKSANSKMIICVDTYIDKFKNVGEKLKIEKKVIVSPSNLLPPFLKMLYKLKVKTPKNIGFENWNEFVERGKDKKISTKFKATGNEVAAIEYTSGTTGIPKGALLSNSSINSVAFQQKSVLPEMKPSDTFLDIMPPFIAYGLVCGMVASLTAGLELILIPKFEPDKFDKLVMKHKPNHVIGVPTFFENLIKSRLVKNEDLSFLKYCIAGGDKMSVEAEKRINEFFKKHNVQNNIIKGYGMTELSSGVIINVDDNTNKLGSVGVPLVKNNIKVLNPDTKEELRFNETGEVYITGPSKMMGYHNASEEMKFVVSEDVDGQEWIKTGDLGKVDEEGHVYIEGRLKRMIIRPDGHNVFPTSIENVILTHPAVENCIVVGVPSTEYMNGEIPVACVVIKDDYKDRIEDIKEQLIKLSSLKLPPRDVALDYKFLEFIPMTSNGKVDINTLKETCSGQDKKIR